MAFVASGKANRYLSSDSCIVSPSFCPNDLRYNNFVVCPRGDTVLSSLLFYGVPLKTKRKSKQKTGVFLSHVWENTDKKEIICTIRKANKQTHEQNHAVCSMYK